MQLNLIAPLDSPLPPVPTGDVLTDSQWKTLLAIADTIVPAVEASSTHSLIKLSVQPSEYTSAVEQIQKAVPPDAPSDAVQKYLAERAGSLPRFKELIQRQFGDYMREDALKGIRVILSTLKYVSG
ncbi:MAG: hypothetical protein Q9184_007163 [Pyrenodesmia sp. 2 TL-2023]